MKKITTAVFPVAGLGTRFLPATKALPKEMMIVGDKPLIQHAVDEAKECGITRFIFVTSSRKSMIVDHFSQDTEFEKILIAKGKTEALHAIQKCSLAEGQAIFTYQSSPLGLGHAVACAAPWLRCDEPFAVMLPDDYFAATPGCLLQMMKSYREGMMVATEKVPKDKVQNYGILHATEGTESLLRTHDIVEKPSPHEAPSNLAVVGRYILPFDIIPSLQNLKPGQGNEIQLTDGIRHLLKHHSTPLYGLLFQGKRFDCGAKEGWFAANHDFFTPL